MGIQYVDRVSACSYVLWALGRGSGIFSGVAPSRGFLRRFTLFSPSDLLEQVALLLAGHSCKPLPGYGGKTNILLFKLYGLGLGVAQWYVSS